MGVVASRRDGRGGGAFQERETGGENAMLDFRGSGRGHRGLGDGGAMGWRAQAGHLLISPMPFCSVCECAVFSFVVVGLAAGGHVAAKRLTHTTIGRCKVAAP